jgi:hypothetical protein
MGVPHITNLLLAAAALLVVYQEIDAGLELTNWPCVLGLCKPEAHARPSLGVVSHTFKSGNSRRNSKLEVPNTAATCHATVTHAW